MLFIRCLFILFFLSQSVFAQLTENFDDGNFTVNPTWTGDSASFAVVSGQLNSSDTIPNSIFYLSTASPASQNAQWEIYLNLKFSTSGSNYVDVFLISDVAEINNASNGYFVRIGGTPDEISLYRNDAGTAVKLIDGVDGRSQIGSDHHIKIKVTRNAINLWTLTDSVSGASPVVFTEGTATDAVYLTSNYFGVSVKQSTPSFFGKHFFDNIYAGSIISDTVPPVINSIDVISQTQIDVYFSEPVLATVAENELNYNVNLSIGSPANAILDVNNASLVHLDFSNSFTDGVLYTLLINNVTDTAGNIMVPNSTGQFLWTAPVTPSVHDVIISEIMADPAIGSSLPPQEYVEIYNRSSKNFNLLNWKVSDATGSPQTFPSVMLLPGEYAIVCDNAYATSFLQYGKVVPVSSMPSLNNDGDLITLTDATGLAIDEVNYDKTYYNNPLKENGGWSIEKVDLNFPCQTSDNWKACMDTIGGTPAALNSVNAVYSDTILPNASFVEILDSLTVMVFFSEQMDGNTLGNPSWYHINNGIGQPSSTVMQIANKTIELQLSTPLQLQTLYTICFSSELKDCSGNSIDTTQCLDFGIPETPSPSDIVINEILFDPYDGGFDFVELYNNSPRIIDLSELFIVEIDATTGLQTDAPVMLSSISRYFLPDTYMAFSANANDIIQRYQTENGKNVLPVAGFPSFNSDENVVALYFKVFQELDRFRYSEDFHYPLLNDTKGYTLERISFNRPSQDSTNWHSASSALKATPAYKNSQSASETASDDEVLIDPETFSPDNDGYSDVLNVSLNFSEAGLTATVQVYDSRGQLVQNLLRNKLLGTQNELSWDGLNIDGGKASIGIYILYVEAFNQNGDVKKYKKPFVLAGKLK